jgi:hypothetical protein
MATEKDSFRRVNAVGLCAAGHVEIWGRQGRRQSRRQPGSHPRQAHCREMRVVIAVTVKMKSGKSEKKELPVEHLNLHFSIKLEPSAFELQSDWSGQELYY